MEPRIINGSALVLFVILAIAVPCLVYLVPWGSWSAWSARVVALSMFEVVLYFVLDWTTVSLGAAWLFAAHATVAPFVGVLRPRRTTREPRRVVRYLAWIGSLMMIVLAAAGLLPVMLEDDARTVELSFPLHHPCAYVLQGGGSPLLNHHIEVASQRRALDLVALGGWGRRASGFSSTRPADYEIYGQEVVAPCDGEVLSARSGEPERPLFAPPLARRIAGNYVLLYCPHKNVTVMLAHLHSPLQIAERAQVRVGTPLGTVGNSGSSSEPHLHIHAVAGRVGDPDVALGDASRGVTIAFESLGTLRRGDRGPRCFETWSR